MRILIIEDSDKWQRKYRAGLPSTIDIVQATNLRSAEPIIEQVVAGTATFNAIVVDACLRSDEPDTLHLVERLKTANFTGPIIAGSNSDYYNSRLMHAGCTHEALSPEPESIEPKAKEGVLPILRTVLGIKP